MINNIIEKYKLQLQKNNQLVLSVKVSVKMPKTGFVEHMDNGTLKLNVNAAREKGKANKEIIKFLSKKFSVPKENIKILSGSTSPLKLIKISKI